MKDFWSTRLHPSAFTGCQDYGEVELLHLSPPLTSAAD
jgi:hypothetical protein